MTANDSIPLRRAHVASAASDSATGAPRAPRKTCLECGQPVAAGAPRQQEFCGAGCRRAWHNRRMVRGAELYDLFMAIRFDRERATELKLWKLANRMAAGFRAEDEHARAGRRSWRRPARVLEEKPYLQAEVILGPARKAGARS